MTAVIHMPFVLSIRRYSDPEPPKPLELDEADKGTEPSWKRLAPFRDDDRDSDRGRENERHRDHEPDRDRHRDDDRDRYRRDDRDHYRGDDRDRHLDMDRDREESQPYVPQPADGMSSL